MDFFPSILGSTGLLPTLLMRNPGQSEVKVTHPENVSLLLAGRASNNTSQTRSIILRRWLAGPAPWLPTPAQWKPWVPPAPPPRVPSLGHPCVASTLPHLWGSCHVSSSLFPLSPGPSSAWSPHHNTEYCTKSELRSGNRSAPGEAQVRLAPESLMLSEGALHFHHLLSFLP